MAVCALCRSSFKREPHRITLDPAATMLAASRTVILNYREGTAVLASSALFMMGAMSLIWLLG